MKGAARRLAAAVEALRAGGGSAADQQMQHRALLQALFALQRLWKPERLARPTDATPAKKSRKSNPSLFQLLLATLIVYSGGHGGSSGGAAGTGASPMTMALSSSSTTTSECVHRLIVDLLVRAFDFSVVPAINEALSAKNTSLYVKTSLVMMICRLPLQDALPFLPEAVAIASKTVRTADYYMKQCLIESVAHALEGDSRRLVSFHAESLKIVAKSFQDKVPEVRIAAAKLLQVVAERTSASASSSASNSNGGNGGSSSGAGNSSGGSGSGGGSGSAASAGNGGGGSSHAGAHGVSLDAILQITAKGMDDASPEARRAYSVVIGTVLAKFATSSSGESEIQTSADSSAAGVASSKPNEEEVGGRHSMEHDNTGGAGGGGGSGGKSKLAFKLPSVHVPGMSTINLPSSLSRRKTATVNFSTIANVVLYFKDMVTTKYLSSNPNQSNGGILSSFSIALCSMFERLPPDFISESQLPEVVETVLLILDHPFALGDLTRARNAVCFVLRYGINVCLTERQQEALLRAYLQKLKDEVVAPEPNHHKMLSVLVELSHMFHSMGEATVSHARDTNSVLQGLLCHEKQSVRFQAAVALASLVTALPYRLKGVLTGCLQGLRDTAEFLLRGGSDIEESRNSGSASTGDDAQDEANNVQSKTHLYAIQGRSTAITHMLRAIKLEDKGGLAQTVMDDIFTIAEELVESQFLNECADSIWLTCTRAGWMLVGSLVAVNDEQWTKTNLEQLLGLWLKSSVLHNRESSLELLRIEAAVIALNGLLCSCQHLAADSENDVNLLAGHVLHVYLTATQDTLSNPLKRRGQVARYRLVTWILNCFVMLPPIYSDSYIVLLDLIAEYTTAQALTSLRHSALVPVESTFLRNVLSVEDNPLEMVTISRLVAGDYPCPLYSRELNHSLGLQQRENALTDTELEVQYLDTFWGSVHEREAAAGEVKWGSCSPFTYVRLVDASVLLFGRLFHFVPEDLQLRCLQHYAGVLADDRFDCEVNVCSLLFAAIAEAKRLDATDDATPSVSSPTTSWPQQMQSMMCEMISSENTKVRRGAGEALGTLALLLGEDHCKGLIIELEKRLAVDKLPSGGSTATFGGNADLDATLLSAGAAFALACIKRVCGSRVSIDTGLILRFASEPSQPLRTWVLHSWSLILESVNSTGGDYEQYVNSTSSLMETHLLAGFTYSKTNKRGLRWQTSARVAMGRIINSVVATLGPDLNGSSERLNEFYAFWGLLRQDGDVRVELEFFKFLEQMVVFAPSRFLTADLGYILRIISDTAMLNSAFPLSLSAPQHSGSPILSPPSGSGPSAASAGPLGGPFDLNGLLNVGAFTNGWSRSLLQKVGLSCIRTLVERDPTLIRRQNLLCLLFSALHVEYNDLTWSYLPGLHGMWDVLSLSSVASSNTQRNGIAELQGTLLALLDVEGGDRQDAEPCLWALLCRSIAIGESASTFSGSASADQLMMSPKGMDSGLAGTMAGFRGSDALGDEDASTWTPTPALDLPKTDANALSSAAIAAQVDTWRATKASVGDLIALMPPLSRQVRHFAVECVLRVFELMMGSTRQGKQLHFDLVAARRYFLEIIADGAAPLTSGAFATGNFLCMYLDEFVTLACHVTTTSAEGDELVMFQCVGLRLLNVLVKSFASARDPEVPTEDAYLLDPYRAQLSSAVRHSLKQVQVEPASSSSEVEESKDEDNSFYAPLLLEAHAIAGKCVAARLVQDKVALGRILRAVVTQDYGHAHFVGDELTRTSLSLANLAAVAELLTSCVAEAITHKDPRDDERRAVAVSPLVKAMTSGLSASMEYLNKCWRDTTFAYGIVMQGCTQWPLLNVTASASLQTGEAMVMPALQMPLPSTGESGSTPEALYAMYKRYWPRIVHAMAVREVYLSSTLVLHDVVPDNMPRWSSVLLSCAIFHVSTSVRDRLEDSEELVAIFQAVPLLLRALVDNPIKDAAVSSGFTELLTSALATLMLASRRCFGSARTEALKALLACLSPQNLAFAREVCRSDREEGERRCRALFAAVGQAGLCPTEALRQVCETNKLSQQTPVTSSSTGCSHSSIASEDEDKHVLEIVRLATRGIVVLHTTEEARDCVVRSVGVMKQPLRSLAMCRSAAVREAAVALSRASIESVLALARSHEATNQSVGDTVAQVQSSVRVSFQFLSMWLQEELSVAQKAASLDRLGFVLHIVANHGVVFPVCLQDDAACFHADVAATTSAFLARIPMEEGGDEKQRKQRHSAVRAELLRGLHGLVKKLIDLQESTTVRRYLAALGPSLVEAISTANGYPDSAVELAELVEAEALLRLLTSQLDDQHGAAFVRLLLPQLAAVLSHSSSPVAGDAVTTQLPAIVARLLLCFAQTRGAAFKETVAAMAPTSRGVLENALRLALTGSAASRPPPLANSQSPFAHGGSSVGAPGLGKTLDLSRYG
ncbi:hypothetical protein BBJ28_00019044 [Nothophytophthora sp. Chile5]|nr:hypothetical protein BBJ28_00019044 [Nothophytophthora sp. Chile5]